MDKNEKIDKKPTATKLDQPEGALADDDLEEVAGGVLPKWWLDGAPEALKKSDPDKIC